MSELKYKVTYLTGSVEFAPAPPGFTRTIEKDGDGKITSDKINHYVHLIDQESGRCIYCNEQVHAPDPPQRWWEFWK